MGEAGYGRRVLFVCAKTSGQKKNPVVKKARFDTNS